MQHARSTLLRAAASLTILVISSALGCRPEADREATGAAAARPPLVALVMKSLANEFFAGMADGARAHHDALAGRYDLVVNGMKNETDVEEQVGLVEQMVAQHRQATGITARAIGDEEIVHRLVYALVNEAAHILEEGIASKASDIDMVYLTGYGFPLWRGGPLCYADQQGLFNVVQAMKRFAANPHDDAAFWQPAPLLARLAAEGRTFT